MLMMKKIENTLLEISIITHIHMKPVYEIRTKEENIHSIFTLLSVSNSVGSVWLKSNYKQASIQN